MRSNRRILALTTLCTILMNTKILFTLRIFAECKRKYHFLTIWKWWARYARARTQAHKHTHMPSNLICSVNPSSVYAMETNLIHSWVRLWLINHFVSPIQSKIIISKIESCPHSNLQCFSSRRIEFFRCRMCVFDVVCEIADSYEIINTKINQYQKPGHNNAATSRSSFEWENISIYMISYAIAAPETFDMHWKVFPSESNKQWTLDSYLPVRQLNDAQRTD